MYICICKGIKDTDPEEKKKTAGTVCGICQEGKVDEDANGNNK